MKWLVGGGLLIVGVLVGAGGVWYWKESWVEPVVEVRREYPLRKFEIESLAVRDDWGSVIELGEVTAQEEGYRIQKFYFQSEEKRVSGLAHIPKGCERCPVIVQFRGYYDPERYYPGGGTSRTAAEFAKAGFVSLAPDFLGYGESDGRAENIFEARFETYTTAVNLIYGVGSLPFVDAKRIGIWGHSNGGHIALTALEITGGSYPTAVWAPVSAPFPYSVLYYTDTYDDDGRAFRKDLAQFEEDYNVERFTLTSYWDLIEAPILWQQGTADADVPVGWSERATQELRGLNKDVAYIKYPGADHNLLPRWNEATAEDIKFFERFLVGE